MKGVNSSFRQGGHFSNSFDSPMKTRNMQSRRRKGKGRQPVTGSCQTRRERHHRVGEQRARLGMRRQLEEEIIDDGVFLGLRGCGSIQQTAFVPGRCQRSGRRDRQARPLQSQHL